MMKYRDYWQGKADERLTWEEAHFQYWHASIFDLPGIGLTLWYCLLALVIPQKRNEVKE